MSTAPPSRSPAPRGSGRWIAALTVLALACAVPFSSPDGTGMQWDELVLTAVAARAAWAIGRRTRSMTGSAARPWQVLAGACAVFGVGQLLAGAFPGPAFDGSGVDDVFTFAGACAPLVTCALLARRVIRTRWSALAADGAMVTASLLVLTEVVRTPLADAAGAPADLRTLVLLYGGLAAVFLGAGSTLCTVSTAALRRSATAMLAAVGLQAAAAACEAMAIVAPSPLWTAGSDLAVAFALLASVLAASRAPDRDADSTARASAPRVSGLGLVVVAGALLGLPLALAVSLLEGEPLTAGAELGIGTVLALVAARLVLRIREDGRLTEDLVRSEEGFRELVESSPNGVAIIDGRLRLVFASPAARRLLGLGADAGEDPPLIDALERADRTAVRAALAHRDAVDLHVRVPAGDGARELELTSPGRQDPGRRAIYLRDVTSLRRRQRELERMAYTDHLTGLPNRAALFEELAAGSPAERCLLVIDLDGFKAVNDNAGHEAGDQLLVEVAHRLRTVVRGDDVVARLGGDEFAVLVAGAVEESTEVAQRVVDALSLPHRTADRSFAVGASVGLAPLGPSGGPAAFREADTALRQAKQSGKGCVRAAEQAALPASAVDLGVALAEGWVQLRYNAAGDAAADLQNLHAVPVLDGPAGTLPTADLWAAAERQGLAGVLQRWLLDRVCREVAALPVPLTAAVDLPAAGATAADLPADVADALAASGLPAGRLALAFTEDVLTTSPVALQAALREVHATGVRICLDDYGMGRTLFAHMARIPISTVRVDVGSLASRGDSETAMRVLSSIADTARRFGIRTVAQGVDGGALTDAALQAGIDLVRSRAHPRSLSLAELTDLLTPALAR